MCSSRRPGVEESAKVTKSDGISVKSDDSGDLQSGSRKLRFPADFMGKAGPERGQKVTELVQKVTESVQKVTDSS